MPVVGNEDDGTLIVVECNDQGLATVDIQVVGRLIEDQQMRPIEGRKPQQQACLLTARKIFRRGFHAVCRQAEPRDPGAYLGLGGLRHERADMGDSTFRRAQLVQLVLGEEGNLQLRCLCDLAINGSKAAGNQLGKGRLAVAVGAKKGDAVVGVDVEREPFQDRLAVIARRRIFQLDDRRRQAAFRVGEMYRTRAFLCQRRDRLQPFQHLQP